MNSLVVLKELRAAKAKKQQDKLQCAEVKKQLEYLQSLHKRKAALNTRLEALNQGVLLDDDNDNQFLRERKSILYDLQEKWWAHRLIGPCGLTVADVNSNLLVVTFTSMWKNTTESYILKIVEVNGKVKVSGTSIPYFIDVQSMVEKSKNPVWHQLMDDIGHKISAYVHRKGELEFVKGEYKDIIKSVSQNEPLTSIEIVTCQKDKLTGCEKEMCIYLVYPKVDSMLPEKVSITTEKMTLAGRTVSAITNNLLENALSSAIPNALSIIESSKVLNV